MVVTSMYRRDSIRPQDVTSVAVAAMLVFYALESKGHGFILAFAVACCLGSLYGFLQGAWPFGVVEAIWAMVAVRRWIQRRPGTPL